MNNESSNVLLRFEKLNSNLSCLSSPLLDVLYFKPCIRPRANFHSWLLRSIQNSVERGQSRENGSWHPGPAQGLMCVRWDSERIQSSHKDNFAFLTNDQGFITTTRDKCLAIYLCCNSSYSVAVELDRHQIATTGSGVDPPKTS